MMTYILLLVLLCLCLVRDVATKDARWVRCSSWPPGPRPRPPTAVSYTHLTLPTIYSV